MVLGLEVLSWFGVFVGSWGFVGFVDRDFVRFWD
jgi:hypothetical protein